MEVPRTDALSAPAGTQLIETLRVSPQGALPLLNGHLARLARSAQALGWPCDVAAIRQTLLSTAELLPRGDIAHRMRLLLDAAGEISLEHAALPPLGRRPLLALASERLDSQEHLLRHKTTHRPWYTRATTWLAEHPDHFDVLFLNERDEVCEGTRTNVYILREGRWLTPPLSSGVLPGVQRAALLARGEAREAVVTLDDLEQAQGVRLSNALRGWFEVELRLPERVAAEGG
ncbi:Para-aminobenzoate synthase, aminase component / Aminodeoxychorismate lyase |uniref:Para-aminobenzoate synthase, aminase component / Aminodeoxychorismate lyase \